MKNTTENTLGARIKAQRIRCGMTQEELAKNLETDANYLLGMEELEKDTFIKEAMELLMKIKDEKVKRLLLKQIAAVVTVVTE